MGRIDVGRILDLLWVLKDYASGGASLEAAARAAAELLDSGFVEPGRFRDALVEVLAAYGAEAMGRPGLAERLASRARAVIDSSLALGTRYAIIDNFGAGIVESVRDAARQGLRVIVYGDRAYISGDAVDVVIDPEVRETPSCIEEPVLPRECIVYIVRGRIGDRRVERAFRRLDEAIDWVTSEAIRHHRVYA